MQNVSIKCTCPICNRVEYINIVIPKPFKGAPDLMFPLKNGEIQTLCTPCVQAHEEIEPFDDGVTPYLIGDEYT